MKKLLQWDWRSAWGVMSLSGCAGGSKNAAAGGEQTVAEQAGAGQTGSDQSVAARPGQTKAGRARPGQTRP